MKWKVAASLPSAQFGIHKKGVICMDYTSLKIEEFDSILVLTVSREERLNALSRVVLEELEHFLTTLRKSNTTLLGLLLTGQGDKSFISGADIREMSLMNEVQGEDFGYLGQRVAQLFESLPFPVIACVNGYAFGGGCEMALSCDLIYATENASFAQPEVNLGLIPGFGGCVRLARRVGPGHAKSMIYSGQRLSATEAQRIGLVDQIFTHRFQMLEAGKNFIREVSSKSLYAVSICKAVINFADGVSIPEGLEMEKRGFRASFSHPDRKEGTLAFLNKEKPNFSPPLISELYFETQEDHKLEKYDSI
jgi:enoyl-CoA hydratase